MDDLQEEFVKIYVDLPEPDLGNSGESLWAVSLGDDVYEIRNSPWHARNLNWGDWVRAVAPDETKKPVFMAVVKRGGHRTVRIFVEKELEQKTEILSEIERLDASYENMNDTVYAVDCPPEMDLVPLVKYLEDLENSGVLKFRTNEFVVEDARSGQMDGISPRICAGCRPPRRPTPLQRNGSGGAGAPRLAQKK